MKIRNSFLVLIIILNIIGCYHNGNGNNNMMGGSRYGHCGRYANNIKSMYLITIVYCNQVNNDCTTNIFTSTTQTQQDIERLRCSNAFNSCMMMGGIAADVGRIGCR